MITFMFASLGLPNVDIVTNFITDSVYLLKRSCWTGCPYISSFLICFTNIYSMMSILMTSFGSILCIFLCKVNNYSFSYCTYLLLFKLYLNFQLNFFC